MSTDIQKADAGALEQVNQVELVEGEFVEPGQLQAMIAKLQQCQGEQLAVATQYLAGLIEQVDDKVGGRCDIDDDDDLIDLWLAPGRGKFSDNTAKAYRRDIHQAREFFDKPIPEVTKRDVLNWKEELAGRHTLNTASRKLAAFKSLLTFAAAENYVAVDVSANVPTSYKTRGAGDDLADKIKGEHRRIKKAQGRLSQGEVFTMFAQVEGRNRLMLRTLYYTGLRVSELGGLQWGDFGAHPNDADKRAAMVNGKGGKLRVVPVRADLWSELEDFRPDDAEDTDPVFVSRKGNPISRQQVFRYVRRAAKRAGIDIDKRPVSPHWLRRACGAHLADRGVPMHKIRDLLGHASVTTTDGYTPSDPTDSVTDILPS